MTRPELAQAIKSAAYMEGDFVLRSGRRSKYYLDKYLFETQPAILQALAEEFAKLVPAGVQRIAGAELGGVPLAAAVGLETGLPFVIVRNAKKNYGTSKQFEGKLEPGERVFIVEDIATTGGQVLEAAKCLQSAGAIVDRIVAVIDRGEGARANIESAGFVFESLFTSADLGIGK